MTNNTNFDGVCRRAGGRRRYNKQRQALAFVRRMQVLVYVHHHGCAWGTFTRLADALGVHRSTILRDVQALYRGTDLHKSRTK